MTKLKVDDLREQLLTVKQARNRFAKTEPLAQTAFPLSGSAKQVAKFSFDPGWNANVQAIDGTAPVDVSVKVGTQEFRLTKDALLEATTLIGLTKAYVSRTPAKYIEPQMNWWYSNQPSKEYKLLAMDDLVLGVTKASIVPFSNNKLLDEALEGIKGHYGDGEVLVDYKFHHDLRKTAFRLIIPEQMRNPRKEDPWSAGIAVHNSLTGESGTSLQGYLFRWVCTNGATSTHAQSGKWNRRSSGQGDEVYEWARHAVDEILGGLEHEFVALEELANSPLEDDVATTLQNLFDHYGIPLAAREAITQNMVNLGDLTMYGVMQAITQAANDPGIDENVRRTLLEIGGDIPRANTNRCKECKRVL